jgi:hypothetical protein
VLHLSDVRGHIWELSQEAQGSRSVQSVLQELSSDDLEGLAVELKGHISDAARCPHANFVLQKFICQKAPKASRFIALELVNQGVEATVQAARHRYGCRIVQRLLEFCGRSEAAKLADFILSDAAGLCTHPYGNYTMQHILTHGQEGHRHRLVRMLIEDVHTTASNFHASAVIGEALRCGSQSDALDLARCLIDEPGLLSQMARTKHGHAAAQLAIKVANAAAM